MKYLLTWLEQILVKLLFLSYPWANMTQNNATLTTPPESVDPRKTTKFQSRSMLILLSHLESFLSCLFLLFKEKPFFAWPFAAAAAKSLQSCPTLWDPIDGSPPGSPIPGILQARTLEWVAISFSNAWKWKVKVKSLSRVRPLATPWTTAYQAPPSMGFSRQE